MRKETIYLHWSLLYIMHRTINNISLAMVIINVACYEEEIVSEGGS